MAYEQWVEKVPWEIRGDTLWRVEAYRLALFFSDLAWRDVRPLLRNPLAREVADQLTRASGKISACIAEGYSRNTGKARAVFYEYACGSARESRDWYYKVREVLADRVVEHRISLSTQIIKLTLKMIATERRRGQPRPDRKPPP